MIQTASESHAVVSDSDVITGSDKDLLIRKTELSTEKVSFIRPIEESKIELLARIGEDGEIKIVLGTCQSCNRSTDIIPCQISMVEPAGLMACGLYHRPICVMMSHHYNRPNRYP